MLIKKGQKIEFTYGKFDDFDRIKLVKFLKDTVLEEAIEDFKSEEDSENNYLFVRWLIENDYVEDCNDEFLEIHLGSYGKFNETFK